MSVILGGDSAWPDNNTCVLCWRGGFLQHVNCWGVGIIGGRENFILQRKFVLYSTGEFKVLEEKLGRKLESKICDKYETFNAKLR